MVDISMNTLMLAIKAVQRDTQYHEKLAVQAADDEDVKYYDQYVLDLNRAMSELGTLYQEALKHHPECPSLDELVGE